MRGHSNWSINGIIFFWWANVDTIIDNLLKVYNISLVNYAAIFKSSFKFDAVQTAKACFRVPITVWLIIPFKLDLSSLSN